MNTSNRNATLAVAGMTCTNCEAQVIAALIKAGASASDCRLPSRCCPVHVGGVDNRRRSARRGDRSGLHAGRTQS